MLSHIAETGKKDMKYGFCQCGIVAKCDIVASLTQFIVWMVAVAVVAHVCTIRTTVFYPVEGMTLNFP